VAVWLLLWGKFEIGGVGVPVVVRVCSRGDDGCSVVVGPEWGGAVVPALGLRG